MKSPIWILLNILCFFSVLVYAQDKTKPDENEVNKSPKVRFVNKSNDRATDYTRDKDYQLGKSLAEKISQGKNYAEAGGIRIERYKAESEDRHGADIITVKKNFHVGHIHSISRILSGFVQTSFDYPKKEADTLVFYILYYNVMHRNDVVFFAENYTAKSVERLKPETAGISTNYKDWPGRTQIVIPLEKNILKSKKTDVTIDELKKVNKDLVEKNKDLDKKEDLDRLLTEKTKEERKALDEKKKEADRTEAKTEEKAKTAEEKLAELKKDPKADKNEIKKLADEKDKLDKKIEEVKEEKKELAKKDEKISKTEKDLNRTEIPKKDETAKIPSKDIPAKDTVKTKIADETPKKDAPAKTDPASKTVTDTKTETLTAKDTVAAKEKEAAAVKDTATEKKTDVSVPVKETDVVPDEKPEKTENIMQGKIVYLQTVKYEEDGHYTNDLWLTDPEKLVTVKSSFKNISGRNFRIVPDGVAVIGFDGNEPSSRVHHLVLLDELNLSMIRKTKEEIYWKSDIRENDGKLYAFEILDGKVYLSRFNSDLSLDRRSSKPVYMNSEITFLKGKIYLTSKLQNAESKNLTVLKKDTMEVTGNSRLSVIINEKKGSRK